MTEVASMSSHFTGPSGALVMSFISISIVFLVIIGLMCIMAVTHRLVNVSIASKSSKSCDKGNK